jgi:quinol monooxygenase YgiN
VASEATAAEPAASAARAATGMGNDNHSTAIKVIVELQAKPGRRAELKSVLDSMITARGPSQHGFLGSTRYEVLADADLLVEIADWESADARTAHMRQAAATGAYAPLLELLAAPFRATVIKQLP